MNWKNPSLWGWSRSRLRTWRACQIFAQNDALNPDNFANPLVTQNGLSPLGVPAPPPLGDLTTDFDFSEPLTAGFLGPPLDLLPPIPMDSGFDNSSFDNSGFDDSSAFLSSAPLPPPVVNPPAPLEIPLPEAEAAISSPLELEEDFSELEVDTNPFKHCHCFVYQND